MVKYEDFTVSDFDALLERLTANDPSLGCIRLTWDRDARRSIGDDDVFDLTSALKRNTTVTDIWLEGCGLNEIGITAVGGMSIALAIQQNEILGDVWISNHPIGDDGVGSIANALADNRSLRNLYLDKCGMTRRGASLVAAALETNKGLKQLWLCRNDIGSVGSDALGDMIRVNNTLESLSLDESDIGDDGTACIAGGLSQNLTLRSLSLEDNRIGPKGARALAAMLETKSRPLRMSLSLGGNNMLGDDGVRALATSLKENTSLQHLDLHSCNVSDRGASFLAEALRGNKALERLALHLNSGITDDGVRALSQALYCDSSASGVWNSNHTLTLALLLDNGNVQSYTLKRFNDLLKIAYAARRSPAKAAREKIGIYLYEKTLSPDTLQLDARLNHKLIATICSGCKLSTMFEVLREKPDIFEHVRVSECSKRKRDA